MSRHLLGEPNYLGETRIVIKSLLPKLNKIPAVDELISFQHKTYFQVKRYLGKLSWFEIDQREYEIAHIHAALGEKKDGE